MKSKLNAKLQ